MRFFFLLGLILLLNSCTNEANSSRNYIISQRNENIEKENK
ncbi:MAG: hypothetical protein K1060chlam5_01056 [Candidatus Anoxychlamydiales bacterium]|nr:hypothetical protein [Candidatus Anoxychlamydiales bacterium]